MSVKQQAVTSIEILIVLAIVALLASLAIPHYFNYIEDSRIRHAAEDVYHKSLWARSTAIKQSQDVRLVLQTGSTWCVGFTTAANCDCSSAGSCNLGRLQSGDYPLTTLTQTGIGSSTVYESNRGTVSATGTLTFSSSGDSLSVEVNRMGLARICGVNIAGYKAC